MLEHWKIRVWFWSRLELIFWHSRASIDQGFISPRHIRLKVAAQRAPESCWTICIVSRDRVTGVSSTMLCHNLFAPQMFPRFFTPVTESAFYFHLFAHWSVWQPSCLHGYIHILVVETFFKQKVAKRLRRALRRCHDLSTWNMHFWKWSELVAKCCTDIVCC